MRGMQGGAWVALANHPELWLTIQALMSEAGPADEATPPPATPPLTPASKPGMEDESDDAACRRALERELAEHPVELEELLESLPDALSSDSPEEALESLAAVVDVAEGELATVLGEWARTSGALEAVLVLISHAESHVHVPAMRILGNLSSDAVDAYSRETKERVRQLDGFPRLLPHCLSEDRNTLMYALGAVQNLCTIDEYAELIAPLRPRLEELVERRKKLAEDASATGAFDNDGNFDDDGMPTDELLGHYAKGILGNLGVVAGLRRLKLQEDRRRRLIEWRRRRQQGAGEPLQQQGEQTTCADLAPSANVGLGEAATAAQPQEPRVRTDSPRLSARLRAAAPLNVATRPEDDDWRAAEWSPFGSSKAASSPEGGSPLGITRKVTARGRRGQLERRPSSLRGDDAPVPSPGKDHERVARLSEPRASGASGQTEGSPAAGGLATDSPGSAWQKAEWSPFQDRPLARRQAPRLGRWRDPDDPKSTTGSSRSLCSDTSDEAGGDEGGAGGSHDDSESPRGALAGHAARRALFTAVARGLEAQAPAESENRSRTSAAGATEQSGASDVDLAPAAATSPGVVSMSTVTTLADAAAGVASSALRCGRQLYRRSTGSIERMELGSYSESGSVPDSPEPSARSEISEGANG